MRGSLGGGGSFRPAMVTSSITAPSTVPAGRRRRKGAAVPDVKAATNEARGRQEAAEGGEHAVRPHALGEAPVHAPVPGGCQRQSATRATAMAMISGACHRREVQEHGVTVFSTPDRSRLAGLRRQARSASGNESRPGVRPIRAGRDPVSGGAGSGRDRPDRGRRAPAPLRQTSPGATEAPCVAAPMAAWPRHVHRFEPQPRRWRQRP
jgi:hypothetical protein